MLELRVNVDPSLVDALGGCLFEAGAGGVAEVEDDSGSWLVVYCDDVEHAALLKAAVEDFRTRARRAFPEAEVGPVLEGEIGRDWEATWLAALQPVRLTDDLVLRPTHATPAPEGEQTLWFEPASCFGSGDHPTTRLAARAVESACLEQVRAGNGQRSGDVDVLDVGTGSGVLCFVAARRGATRALGIDIDSTAVAAANRNAELNTLGEQCRFSETPLEAITDRYSIVVANIDARTLQELAAPLVERLMPGGVLLLTGLLDEQEHEVLRCFRDQGARLDARQQDGDWVLLALSGGEFSG